MGEVGRAADGQIRRGVDRRRAPFPMPCAWRPWSPCRNAPCGKPRALRTRPSGSVAGDRGFECRALRRCGEPLLPCARAPRSRVRRLRARPRRSRPGTSNGACGQPILCAGGGDLGLAQRRAMRLFRALQIGRALADHRPAGDQRRPLGELRCRDRLGDGFHVVAVDRHARSSRRPRNAPAGPSRWRARSGRRWKSSCRPTARSARASFRWPARSIASWLMPSCRQPSPAMT